jgi:hypothetical protein
MQWEQQSIAADYLASFITRLALPNTRCCSQAREELATILIKLKDPGLNSVCT